MSKVYTVFHKLEKKFPNLIFEMDYSKITKIGSITVRDRNRLQTKRTFEIHNFSTNKPISTFDDETGNQVNLLKEIKNFDAYVKMSRNIDTILNI